MSLKGWARSQRVSIHSPVRRGISRGGVRRLAVVTAGEVGAPYVIGAGEQILARSLQDDAPDAEHVRVDADAERQRRELLNQEHGNPAARGRLDEWDHALDDDRGEPLGHLVDEEHPWLADAGPGQAA